MGRKCLHTLNPFECGYSIHSAHLWYLSIPVISPKFSSIYVQGDVFFSVETKARKESLNRLTCDLESRPEVFSMMVNQTLLEANAW